MAHFGGLMALTVSADNGVGTAWIKSRKNDSRTAARNVEMKKFERCFVVGIDQQAHLGVSPESMLSIKLMETRTGKENMTYSASIEFVHAALARKHVRENPTGKKRPENMVPLYRVERDMILTAKFAIQRGGISSPAFVILAQKAFKIARRDARR